MYFTDCGNVLSKDIYFFFKLLTITNKATMNKVEHMFLGMVNHLWVSVQDCDS